MSAQPAEHDDPLDPQRILDRLPEDERESFLEQYQEAVENARAPVGWKQLRHVLRLWKFHADAAGEPGYREALDAARGPISDMLVRTLARICDDPYDPVFSVGYEPAGAGVPWARR